MTTERRYTDEDVADAKAALYDLLPEDEKARHIAEAEFDHEVARITAMSPDELTVQLGVYKALIEGKRQSHVDDRMASRRKAAEGLSEQELREFLVLSEAREAVERDALVDDAWVECEAQDWPFRKRAAAVRYVWTLAQKYPRGTLTGITGADLRDMVTQAGVGYDAYLSECRVSKLKGTRVTEAGPVKVTKVKAPRKAQAPRGGKVSKRDLKRAVSGR